MDKETDTLTSAKLTDLRVQVYSPNVAVAIGDAAEKGTDKEGESFDRLYRFTDTRLERGGKWQCIAEQVSEVKRAPLVLRATNPSGYQLRQVSKYAVRRKVFV